MNYSTPPASLTALNQRLRNLENEDLLVTRRRVAMALVIVGQLLPEGSIKGGKRHGASLWHCDTLHQGP